MKKRFFYLIIASISCMAMLTSCQKSNADLIKDYEGLCKEIVEATKAGNLVKVATLSEKGAKLEKELSKRTLTDDEKAQLLELQANTATAVAGGAAEGFGNIVDSAADTVEKIKDSADKLDNLLNGDSDEN